MPSDQPASVADYAMRLFEAGLGIDTTEVEPTGLAKTFDGIWVRDNEGALRAMGLLIGDGSCFAQVVDITVHPDRQRKGDGNRMISEFRTWEKAHLPSGCYVSPTTEPEVERLYERPRFEFRTGMARRVP